MLAESMTEDLLNGTKNDTSQVKRIVLACERDMEDFTAAELQRKRQYVSVPMSDHFCHTISEAAMDAVNVDLDEMRARVDSTHSIITSRQRVEVPIDESSHIMGKQYWYCQQDSMMKLVCSNNTRNCNVI